MYASISEPSKAKTELTALSANYGDLFEESYIGKRLSKS